METESQTQITPDETEILVESDEPPSMVITSITSEAITSEPEDEQQSEIPDELLNESNTYIDVPQSQNPLQCRYCGKVFTRSFYRKEHERIHTGEKPFSCGFCGKRFNSQGSCRKHERTHMRSKSRTHECEHCGKNFKDMTNLRAHLRSHTGEKPYACEICGRSFSFETVLKKHMMFHNGQKQFHCMVCSKAYFTAYDLRIHVRSHTGEKPYKCRFCTQTFATGRRRNLHEKCHERTGAHHCKQCGMIFRSVNSLALHQVKSQLAGGCSYINNTDQSAASEDISLEIEQSYLNQRPDETRVTYEQYNAELDNEEVDIEFLGQTLNKREEIGAPGGSANYQGSENNIYPTGLLTSTDRGIKREPFSDHDIPNEQYYNSVSIDRPFDNNTVEQTNHTSLKRPSTQSDNLFDRPLHNHMSSELSVISTDEKAVQTTVLSDTDKMLSDLEMSGKVHECKHCRIYFREYSMFLVHKTLHINPVKPFVCHLCGNEAENRVDFNAHHIWHMK